MADFKGVYVPPIVRHTHAEATRLINNLADFRQNVGNDHLSGNQSQAQAAIDGTIRLLGSVEIYLVETGNRADLVEAHKAWKEIKIAEAIGPYHDDPDVSGKLIKAVIDVRDNALALRAPADKDVMFHALAGQTLADLNSEGLSLNIGWRTDDKTGQLVRLLCSTLKGSEIPYLGIAMAVSASVKPEFAGSTRAMETVEEFDARVRRFAKNFMEATSSRVPMPDAPDAKLDVDPRKMQLV